MHPAVVASGAVPQVAAVLLDAVDEALVVVVDDGGGAAQRAEVAGTELAGLAVEGLEDERGDVEVVEGGGANAGIDEVGGSVGVPVRDDVEAEGEHGVLGGGFVVVPFHRHELDEDGGRDERGLLLDELDLAVPQVEVTEDGLALPVGDGHQLLLDGEVEVFKHGIIVLRFFQVVPVVSLQ